MTPLDWARMCARGFRAALRQTIVTALEPTKGPWVNQNTFGDQFFHALPATENQVMAVLPKNTGLYGPPAVHSLQLGRSDDVDAENADVRARITIGCGGVENSFDCDWVHGLQLALVCNSISVQAVTYRPILEVPYSTSDAAVALKAMVAKGTTTQGRCPATYTEARIVLENAPDPASFVDYTFPDFARELTVHLANNNNPATATGVTVTFFNEGAQDLATYDGQVFAGGRSVPIPGGANKVRISNASGGPKVVTAQWFLGL